MKSLIKDICSRCLPPRILCGDFNAHHSLWGDKVENDKKPTFFRPQNSTIVIDLVIHTTDVTVSATTLD
ncbi:hypothetical protein HPB50_002289 [Hyalomma asiaticum]|uniref:Uncharacterized protein n=1 Tax=Hyalomma asiaticum TaxID=266040 RepID=A0ACB7SQI7_HYAAI|nr:hypothetical protein HPB50_002289 [Hyalomma asiaticum]